MNILVIGNGFDIAHGLPTTYKDFINFIDILNRLKSRLSEGKTGPLLDIQADLNRHFRNYFLKYLSVDKKSVISEKLFYEGAVFSDALRSELDSPFLGNFYDLVHNNFWVDYFLHRFSTIENGWVDFEREISETVILIGKYREEFVGNQSRFLLSKYRNETACLMLFNLIFDSGDKFEFSLDEFYGKAKKRMLDDLNRLTFAFNLYLSEIVEKIKIDCFSPDIEELDINCILSFNYTSTFGRHYCAEDDYDFDFDFIHGQVSDSHTPEYCSLIIGIDDYDDPFLSGNIEFIEFKKYFQRIHKETGCKYKSWLKEQTYVRGYRVPNEIYIFGHSLDSTDKDILKELIDSEDTVTTIFYHSRETYAKQIANLVKVLGRDNLIGKTYCEDKKIIFKKQREFKKL